jgi:hypothetical protein
VTNQVFCFKIALARFAFSIYQKPETRK